MQLPAELIVDVFSVGRRVIYDLVGAVLQGLHDSLGGASANGVIVQMEADSFGRRVVLQELLQSHGQHLFPLALEHPGEGEQGVSPPIPSGAMLQGCVAQQVDGRLKHMDRRGLPGQAEGKGIALVAARGLSLVGAHGSPDGSVPSLAIRVIADEHGIVILRRLIQKPVVDAGLQKGTVNAPARQIGNHPFRPALHCF